MPIRAKFFKVTKMARPINPKSRRQLAIKNGISIETLRYRLDNMKMDKIDALILPKIGRLKVTDKQILECEKLGLTISRSACVLGISQAALSIRIKKLGLTWRGKGEQFDR